MKLRITQKVVFTAFWKQEGFWFPGLWQEDCSRYKDKQLILLNNLDIPIEPTFNSRLQTRLPLYLQRMFKFHFSSTINITTRYCIIYWLHCINCSWINSVYWQKWSWYQGTTEFTEDSRDYLNYYQRTECGGLHVPWWWQEASGDRRHDLSDFPPSDLDEQKQMLIRSTETQNDRLPSIAEYLILGRTDYRFSPTQKPSLNPNLEVPTLKSQPWSLNLKVPTLKSQPWSPNLKVPTLKSQP